ncbi:MAG: GGDEF domain-containing protein, partial [Clostridia bacterium]|nr:GGDEF domain-containing protein [Clostridia bacterium]
LHIRNNKYGHAAGDEMLIYIANSLKEVFYGQHIYRMGGDEFLVFAENSSQDDIKKGIDMLTKQLESMDYHVAIGVSYRAQNTNTEEMVREAEIRMYEAKAQYYQNKENKSVSATDATEYNVIKTGIGEIDTLLDVMKDRYNGIYRVSLNTDEACRILMPTYLGYNETEKSFKDIFAKYVEDMVDPDFHRAMLSFINYDAIKRQLAKGNIPKITYKKVNSETVVLSVYSFAPTGKEVDNTLWVFEKI